MPTAILLLSRLWLCGARECSVTNTIVKPLSAQSVLRGKQVRMCVSLCAAASIFSALAPLRIEIVFLLSEYRQASERQEFAHDCTCPIATCLEPEVADLDFECPFICGMGVGVLVTLALVTLRWLCSCREKPLTLRVRRVRLRHGDDISAEQVDVAQSRTWDRRVVSR